MEAYRITHKKWSSSLFAPGIEARWNSKGVQLIYCANSRSLACLENVVHRNRHGLVDNFRVMVIYIPDDIRQIRISVSELPTDWNLSSNEAQMKCRFFGDNWVMKNESAILLVPSAIIKNENNILINPNHEDFKRIKIIDTEPFFFDPRIKEDISSSK